MSLRRNHTLSIPDTFAKLKGLVTCAVCFELLQNPKVFPCLHSYCYECIVQLSKRECGLKCPECRSAVDIGDPPDPSTLPTNFFANNVLATLSLADNSDAPPLLCDNCEQADQSVEKRCTDCQHFLCSLCAESHQRSCETRNHVLLSRDELRDNRPAENAKAIKCIEHKDELIKFYCDSCKKTICMSCTVLGHKSHQVLALEESASKAKQEVQSLVAKVEGRVKTVSEGIDCAVSKRQDICDREEACKSQIETFFTQLHQEIDAEKNKMLAISTNDTEFQKHKIDASKKVLDLALSTCQNGVNFAKHSLRNGNDVQLLDIKPTITLYLGNLINVQDEVTPDVGNPVRLLKCETSSDLWRQVTANLCSVEEVAVCPEKCEAKILDPMLKVGKKSAILVTLKDKDGRIISSGSGKDVIDPVFTDGTLKDVNVLENQDGTHTISFVVNELGTLQFKAKINGCVAAGCSLKLEVMWELSNIHGCGYLRMDELMVNCLSGQGDAGNYSFRLGDTAMTTGVHRWKVEVRHAIQDAKECLQNGPAFEVGVIEASHDYSEASIFEGHTKKWVYSEQPRRIATVFLKLDMERKSLEVLPGGKILVATPKFSVRRKVFNIGADSVFPFFSVNCPHCSLTFSVTV